jgi:hypothetical protein
MFDNLWPSKEHAAVVTDAASEAARSERSGRNRLLGIAQMPNSPGAPHAYEAPGSRPLDRLLRGQHADHVPPRSELNWFRVCGEKSEKFLPPNIHVHLRPE